MARRAAAALLPLLLAAGAEAGEDGYYWPKRSRDVRLTGTSPHVGPGNLEAGPTWSWPNDGDELTRHGPLIDDKKSIYLVTSQGWVRKFSPDGELLWTWRTDAREGRIVACGALYNGSVYVASTGFESPGFLFALSMQTGEVRLRTQLPAAMGQPSPDSHTLVVQDGVVFLPSRDTHIFPPYIGNNKVVALSASDGSLLWQRTIAEESEFTVVWNFMPALPGDGTMLLATPTARAYRLNASTGETIWKAPFPEPHGWRGCGGGALSPDGRRFFALGAYHGHSLLGTQAPLRTLPPCGDWGCVFGDGVLIAYDVEDGAILWSRRFFPGTSGQQYPAVGGIDGPGSRTAVFVGVGRNTLDPKAEMGPRWLPRFGKRAIARLQMRIPYLRRLLEVPVLENHLLALDAETGAEIWHWQEEPWDRRACAGDEERFVERVQRFRLDPTRAETTCMPDSWAIPTVGGDGTVYAGSGHSGKLYAIRDADRDGRIGEDEVSTFDAHSGFLNGPSLAPGLLVASPCWGPMHVFKS
mmetsp:Transcript_21647/g.65068  ORF Transcript_21647/g.65068 Transcript_21647/m.65068 type:complete len:525 (-) Transcript_21647:61-1635(-)